MRYDPKPYQEALELAGQIGMPAWWWRSHLPEMGDWTPAAQIMKQLRRFAEYKAADPRGFEQLLAQENAAVGKAMAEANARYEAQT